MSCEICFINEKSKCEIVLEVVVAGVARLGRGVVTGVIWLTHGRAIDNIFHILKTISFVSKHILYIERGRRIAS